MTLGSDMVSFRVGIIASILEDAQALLEVERTSLAIDLLSSLNVELSMIIRELRHGGQESKAKSETGKVVSGVGVCSKDLNEGSLSFDRDG